MKKSVVLKGKIDDLTIGLKLQGPYTKRNAKKSIHLKYAHLKIKLIPSDHYVIESMTLLFCSLTFIGQGIFRVILMPKIEPCYTFVLTLMWLKDINYISFQKFWF